MRTHCLPTSTLEPCSNMHLLHTEKMQKKGEEKRRKGRKEGWSKGRLKGGGGRWKREKRKREGRRSKLYILHDSLSRTKCSGSEIFKYLHIHNELPWRWDAYLHNTYSCFITNLFGHSHLLSCVVFFTQHHHLLFSNINMTFHLIVLRK